MEGITEIDRIRIHSDLEQLGELVSRKQVLWETATDQVVKDELAVEISAHSDLMTQLQAQL